MHNVLGALHAVSFVLLLLAPIASRAIDLWEHHNGDPCCGVPDENYKYSVLAQRSALQR
jgi:hypothetical protein